MEINLRWFTLVRAAHAGLSVGVNLLLAWIIYSWIVRCFVCVCVSFRPLALIVRRTFRTPPGAPRTNVAVPARFRSHAGVMHNNNEVWTTHINAAAAAYYLHTWQCSPVALYMVWALGLRAVCIGAIINSALHRHWFNLVCALFDWNRSTVCYCFIVIRYYYCYYRVFRTSPAALLFYKCRRLE